MTEEDAYETDHWDDSEWWDQAWYGGDYAYALHDYHGKSKGGKDKNKGSKDKSKGMHGKDEMKGKQKGAKNQMPGKGKAFYMHMQDWWPEQDVPDQGEDSYYTFQGNCGKCGKWGHKSSQCWAGKSKAQIEMLKNKMNKTETEGAHVAADEALEEGGYFGIAWMAIDESTGSEDSDGRLTSRDSEAGVGRE